MIHLADDDKIGLGFIFVGICFIFLGTYWTPLAVLGTILVLIGGFIWNPLNMLLP